MNSCLFFGDSITLGENDAVFGGWVDILKRDYFKEFSNGLPQKKVFNLGIGGETTEGLLKRIEVEINARKSLENTIIFLSFGANDLVFLGNKYIVNIHQFEQNLEEAILIAKKTTSKITLLSILPIANKVDGLKLESGKIRTNIVVKKYNSVIKKLAQKHAVNYLNLHDEFSTKKELFLSNEGVHPNEKGYQFIANKVAFFIAKNVLKS